MLKVLVNIDCLVPPLTGVGRYTKGILRELIVSTEIEDIVAFSTFGFYNRDQLAVILASDCPLGKDMVDPNLINKKSSVAKSFPINSLILSIFQLLKPWLKRIPGMRVVRNSIRFYRIKRKYALFQDYIYWEPNYLLVKTDIPAVVVIHDISHERLPGFHPSDRLKEMFDRMPYTLTAARRLIGVSKFTKSEIQCLYKPKQPIDVVTPAVDSAFFNVTGEERIRVIKKYGLPRQFVVSVATLEPRKNLEGLISAYADLPEEYQKEFPLILMGTKGWLSSEMAALIDEMHVKGVLRYLGYVDQLDLPAIVAQADVSIYVSFYEGFGMPIAEAMAAGTAVLTSNVTSMPEVAQGAAVLVDPYSPDSIRAGLLQLLQNAELRAALVERGRIVALNYTWENSASNLIESLNAVSRNKENP